MVVQLGWAVARSRVRFGQAQTTALGGFAARPGAGSPGEGGGERYSRSSSERKGSRGLGSAERLCQIKIEAFCNEQLSLVYLA